MLMLFKPWKKITTDLKSPNETPELECDTFMLTTSLKPHHIISGIQYYYECESLVQHHATQIPWPLGHGNNIIPDIDLTEDCVNENRNALDFNEEGLVALIAFQTSWREELHGRLAVEAAKLANIFSDNEATSLPTVNMSANTNDNASGDYYGSIHLTSY